MAVDHAALQAELGFEGGELSTQPKDPSEF
jgi:hypothetical protein